MRVFSRCCHEHWICLDVCARLGFFLCLRLALAWRGREDWSEQSGLMSAGHWAHGSVASDCHHWSALAPLWHAHRSASCPSPNPHCTSPTLSPPLLPFLSRPRRAFLFNADLFFYVMLPDQFDACFFKIARWIDVGVVRNSIRTVTPKRSCCVPVSTRDMQVLHTSNFTQAKVYLLPARFFSSLWRKRGPPWYLFGFN